MEGMDDFVATGTRGYSVGLIAFVEIRSTIREANIKTPSFQLILNLYMAIFAPWERLFL